MVGEEGSEKGKGRQAGNKGLVINQVSTVDKKNLIPLGESGSQSRTEWSVQ